MHLRRLGAVLLVGCAVAACSNVRGFSRELDVHFSGTATQQQRDDVTSACGQLPHVSPLPPPAPGSAAARTGDLAFDITKTSTKELSDFYACLNGKPGVVGASEPDS